MTIARKQDRKHFLEWKSAASFMHFELLRRESKEDSVKVGESKVGMRLQDS